MDGWHGCVSRVQVAGIHGRHGRATQPARLGEGRAKLLLSRRFDCLQGTARQEPRPPVSRGALGSAGALPSQSEQTARLVLTEHYSKSTGSTSIVNRWTAGLGSFSAAISCNKVCTHAARGPRTNTW